MTEATTKKKLSGFMLLNILLAIAFFLFGGLYIVLFTPGIALILLIPSIIVNVLLACFYRTYKQNGTMKVPLIASRCIAVLLLILALVSPLIGSHFTYEPSMYFLKRTLFVYGVRLDAGDVLPHKLPDNRSEYYFHTGSSTLAQDDHPYADLVFRCDGGCFGELAENAEKHGLERRSPAMSLDDYLSVFPEDDPIMQDADALSSLLADYTDVPSPLLYRLGCENMLRFAEHAEVYRRSGAGCAFDRATGYVIIWG